MDISSLVLPQYKEVYGNALVGCGGDVSVLRSTLADKRQRQIEQYKDSALNSLNDVSRLATMINKQQAMFGKTLLDVDSLDGLDLSNNSEAATLRDKLLRTKFNNDRDALLKALKSDELKKQRVQKRRLSNNNSFATLENALYSRGYDVQKMKGVLTVEMFQTSETKTLFSQLSNDYSSVELNAGLNIAAMNRKQQEQLKTKKQSAEHHESALVTKGDKVGLKFQNHEDQLVITNVTQGSLADKE